MRPNICVVTAQPYVNCDKQRVGRGGILCIIKHVSQNSERYKQTHENLQYKIGANCNELSSKRTEKIVQETPR